jgi:hypothetical protein
MAEERSAPAALLLGGERAAPLPADGECDGQLLRAGQGAEAACGQTLPEDADADDVDEYPQALDEVPWRCLDVSHAASCTR